MQLNKPKKLQKEDITVCGTVCVLTVFCGK